MTLSIIIPTHKRFSLLSGLLKSIAEQYFPYEDLQVLLISNKSDKKLRKQVPFWDSVFFDFKYKELGLLGVNKARNMGIRFAGGDILYFLDDDCLLPHKNHLKNLVLEHKKHPEAMGIGGSYKSLGYVRGLEKFYNSHSREWLESFIFPDQSTGQLIGGNASYKREVFDRGFYFDPLIIFGGAEESFNQSLQEAGWTLLYSQALWVFHRVNINWLSFIRKSFRQGLGSFKNRLPSDKKRKGLFNQNSFFSRGFSFYAFVYNLFFKAGYLWGFSSSVAGKSLVFRFFYFLFLIAQNRWSYLSKFVRYNTSWIYGHFVLRFLGQVWFALGWIYGHLLLKLFGWIWFALGQIWFAMGWIYGHLLLKLFGWIWFALGQVWFAMGWVYGHLLLKLFGWIWFALGQIWFAMGWIYGHLLLKALFPLRKIYFFSQYQYHNRIKTFFKKRNDSLSKTQ